MCIHFHTPITRGYWERYVKRRPFFSPFLFSASRMTRSFDNYTCECDVRSLGSYNTKCVAPCAWNTVMAELLLCEGRCSGPCRCSETAEWALPSLHSNCCSCPSSCLPSSFCFPCMLDGPHRREQEEKPSEPGIQCEMEMLWDCLLPGKTFHFLSSFFSHLGFQEKDL